MRVKASRFPIQWLAGTAINGFQCSVGDSSYRAQVDWGRAIALGRQIVR